MSATAGNARLLQHARATIGRGSRSFALASRLFDAETGRRARLLYAWCRHCDDVIDEQELGEGHVARAGTPPQRLAELRARTAAALDGRPEGEAFEALALVARATAMPRRYPFDLLVGFERDVAWRPLQTEDELFAYAYGVAGAVGVMMAISMGVDAHEHGVLARASDLGIAFQLSNIARDVAEDAARGRCYLPAAWLAAEGLSPGAVVADPTARRAELFRVVERLVKLASRYEASALHGVPALRRRQAWAVLSAAAIYGGIGRKLAAAGPDALARRMTTSAREKLYAVAASMPRALVRARRPGLAGPPREGLWTPDFA